MGNMKKFYINCNFEGDEYGWIYMGMEIKKDSVFVYEELTGNNESYDLPLSDLKEISESEYLYLRKLIEDDVGFALDVTIEEIINDKFLI